MTKIFLSLLKGVDSLETKDWKLKIKFPEYSYLREAISSMIDFTLFDTNERMLDTKGSGIQRTVLLSLIQYVNSKTRKDVIWAIDEPEAFLQASLQKSLFNKLKSESKKNQIIVTTHSQFFINVNNLENTFLFESKIDTQQYVRKNNKIYHKLDTEVFEGQSFEKAERIKVNFGLKRNDTWEIMPHNILVEGLEDKDYLISLLNIFSFPIPNILSAGGVSKYSGYLQFINDYCDDLNFKPTVVALFDKDSRGRSEYNSLNSPKKKANFKNIELINQYVINYNGEQPNDIEIEDLIPFNIVIDAANKILRKRKFSIIKAKDRKTRTLPVYKNKPILDVLNEFARLNNTKKPYEVKFDTLDMKLLLSRKICKMLETKSEYQDQIYHNVIIKEWLQTIITGQPHQNYKIN